MARSNTEIGGYVPPSSHFQRNGDDDSNHEKNITVYRLQPVESKVEFEELTENSATGRISKNIAESILTKNTTVTTRSVSRTTQRNESKVTQSSKELHREDTMIDSKTSHSATSVYNSSGQDHDRNLAKRNRAIDEERGHNDSFNRTDSRESSLETGSQSASGGDIFATHKSFHDHRGNHDPSTSISGGAGSLSVEEEISASSSRYRSNANQKQTRDSLSTNSELALTSSEDLKHTGREPTSSLRIYRNFKSSEDAQKSTNVYYRSRPGSGDWDSASLRSEGLDPRVTRYDVSSLGKVVDDLKEQSGSLERTIAVLKNKRSKSLEGIDDHRKPQSASDVMSVHISEMSSVQKETENNTQKVNARKKIYRGIPARAEYVTAVREASSSCVEDGEFQGDEFPFKESASFPSSSSDVNSSREQPSKNSSGEARKEIHCDGLESTTANECSFSQDDDLSRGETKANGRVLRKAEAFEEEDYRRTGLDEANHTDEFRGKKETILRRSADTVEQTKIDERVENKTEAFEGEIYRNTGLDGENHTDEFLGKEETIPRKSAGTAEQTFYKREERSKYVGSITKRLQVVNSTVRVDAYDSRDQTIISSSPIENREGRIVKEGWVSEQEFVDAANSESRRAIPTSKKRSSPDNSKMKKETVTEKRSSDSLTTAGPTHVLRNQEIVHVPSVEETETKLVVDRKEIERKISGKKDDVDSISERGDKVISMASAEHNNVTATTEVKEKKPGSRSALWQKIEKLKNTVDSLNGLKSKKHLEEYVKQHQAKKADIEEREKLMIQRYIMTEKRSGSKDLRSTDVPVDLEAMSLEELEMWQHQKEITRERERKERQEEIERRRHEIQVEREHHEKTIILEREKEVNERRERLLSLEKNVKAAEREREELQKKKEAELERERQKRQEEEARRKRERGEQRRESIRLEKEREDLRTQLERIKAEKEEREREVARLEQERQEKLIDIEREKEVSKLEWAKLDRERQRRESEVARIEREQERKLMLLQRENEATRLDREQLVRETVRLDTERRDKLVFLEREKEAARLEREKLENEMRRREREVAGIERELKQKMMVLHEEKDAARFEREELERRAAKLEIERQQKLETLEKESKATRLERERLDRERQEREKVAMKLEKEQQDKLAVLQMEIEAAQLERKRLEQERRKRESEAANLEIWHHEKSLVLEKEKEAVKVERETLDRERQERDRESMKEEEGQQVKLIILKKEKEAVLLQRERLEREREIANRERRQIERHREATQLERERKEKMMSIERRRKTAEMDREQHEKMLSLLTEKENTRREKEELEQEKEIARKQLSELERLREIAELEREYINRQKQVLGKEREAERLRKETGNLSTGVERHNKTAGAAREEPHKLVHIIDVQKATERLERGQVQNAEIQRSNLTGPVATIKVPWANDKTKIADPHDADVTYVEIDHSRKSRPLKKEPPRWWGASTAEDVDKILELGSMEWSIASTTENIEQPTSNDPKRRPRRMNGIRRRSIRRKNGCSRGQEEDDNVEVCVRVRRKENGPNLSRHTVTSQGHALENAIILRQARETAVPFIRTMRVDNKYGGGTVTLENGVVKIRGGRDGKRRKALSKAIKREEKLSESDGSQFMEGTDADIETHATENGTESPRANVIPVKITTEHADKSRTKRLKFVRELKRTGSFAKARRASAKKLLNIPVGGKHRKGAVAVSTVNGGDMTASNSSKAYSSPFKTVERIRRMYKTTNHASGWTYNGGRLEITVRPSQNSPAKMDMQQLGESMTKGGTTAGSEAWLHSTQTSNGGNIRLRDHGWKVTEETGPNTTRPITSDARSLATFDEKHEVISDTGYNTLSDGEVVKPAYGRVEQISGEHSPTDRLGIWSTTSSDKESAHSRENFYSRKMSWAVGDVTSKFSGRKQSAHSRENLDSPRKTSWAVGNVTSKFSGRKFMSKGSPHFKKLRA